MNKVIDKLPALVQEELAAANAEHPAFHSLHEGYAVLLEEVEEAKNELLDVEIRVKGVWRSIRKDLPELAAGQAKAIEGNAIRLAAEAIQVAAMAEKLRACAEGCII